MAAEAASASVTTPEADAAKARGTALYRAGKFAEAARVYLSAAEMAPRAAVYVLNAAAALLEGGEYARAAGLASRAAGLAAEAGDGAARAKAEARAERALALAACAEACAGTAESFDEKVERLTPGARRLPVTRAAPASFEHYPGGNTIGYSALESCEEIVRDRPPHPLVPPAINEGTDRVELASHRPCADPSWPAAPPRDLDPLDLGACDPDDQCIRVLLGGVCDARNVLSTVGYAGSALTARWQAGQEPSLVRVKAQAFGGEERVVPRLCVHINDGNAAAVARSVLVGHALRVYFASGGKDVAAVAVAAAVGFHPFLPEKAHAIMVRLVEQIEGQLDECVDLEGGGGGGGGHAPGEREAASFDDLGGVDDLRLWFSVGDARTLAELRRTFRAWRVCAVPAGKVREGRRYRARSPAAGLGGGPPRAFPVQNERQRLERGTLAREGVVLLAPGMHEELVGLPYGELPPRLDGWLANPSYFGFTGAREDDAAYPDAEPASDAALRAFYHGRECEGGARCGCDPDAFRYLLKDAAFADPEAVPYATHQYVQDNDSHSYAELGMGSLRLLASVFGIVPLRVVAWVGGVTEMPGRIAAACREKGLREPLFDRVLTSNIVDYAGLVPTLVSLMPLARPGTGSVEVMPQTSAGLFVRCNAWLMDQAQVACVSHLERLLGWRLVDGEYKGELRFTRVSGPLPWRAAGRKLIPDSHLADWVQAFWFRCVTQRIESPHSRCKMHSNLSAATFVRVLHELLVAGHPPHVLERALAPLLAQPVARVRASRPRHFEWGAPLHHEAGGFMGTGHGGFSPQLETGLESFIPAPERAEKGGLALALGARREVFAAPYALELGTVLALYRDVVPLPSLRGLFPGGVVRVRGAVTTQRQEPVMIDPWAAPAGRGTAQSHDCSIGVALFPPGGWNDEYDESPYAMLEALDSVVHGVDVLSCARISPRTNYSGSVRILEFWLPREYWEANGERDVVVFTMGDYERETEPEALLMFEDAEDAASCE